MKERKGIRSGRMAAVALLAALTGLCAGAQQYVTAGLFGLVGVVVVVIMAFIYEAES